MIGAWGKVNLGPGFWTNISNLAQTGVAVGGGLAAQRQQTLQAIAAQEAAAQAAQGQSALANVQAQAAALTSRTTLMLGLAGLGAVVVLGVLGMVLYRRRRR